MKKILFVLLFFFASTIIFADCEEDLFYENVVNTASDLIGETVVPDASDGTTFTSDCIGFVRYCFYENGVDLSEGFGDGENGVSILYNGLVDMGLIYSNVAYTPMEGDLIFFDDTYDKDDDGEWNDPLSHIGIVESVEAWGTINYIHYSGSGIKRAQINLYFPYTYAFTTSGGDLNIINSYLRRDRGEGYDKYYYISAHFFRAFARIPVKKENAEDSED